MTREEHIENLETIGCDGWTVSTEAYKSLQWAIKALEQEPRKDEVILTNKEYRELVSNEYENGYAKGYREALEQEPRWIPVSERLPEDGIPCICTVYNTNIYRDNIQVYDNYLVYDEYTEQWIDDDMELCPYEVLAWMPLPEPYKAESEE